MTTKSAPPPQAAPSRVGQLAHNKLRTFDIVFFVIAAAAPLTVVAGGSPLAFRLGGIGTPGAYLLGGIVYVLFAFGFTAMSEHLTNAGAFYVYIGRGLNHALGVGSALVALASYALICCGFYGALGYFAQTTVADLVGVSIPWPVWAFLGVVIAGLLGYRQIDIGARVLGVFMAAEVAILAIVAVAVLLKGGPEPMSAQSFAPSHVFAAGSGAMFVLALGAFLGFEGTAIYAEEATEPRRSIPRATYISVAFLALFYGLITWVATVGFGAHGIIALAASDDFASMYFTLANSYVGHLAQVTMEILIVTSVFAAIVAFHNASSRYMFALGRERILPPALASTHTRHGSPHVASVVMTVLSAVAVGVTALLHGDPYLQLLLWTNGVGIVGVVTLQVLCAVAVVRFFWASPRGHHRGRVLVAPALAAAALAAGVYLMLANFDLLTGRTGWINAALVSPLILLGIAGIGYGLRMRSRDRQRYDTLVEDESSPTTAPATSS